MQAVLLFHGYNLGKFTTFLKIDLRLINNIIINSNKLIYVSKLKVGHFFICGELTVLIRMLCLKRIDVLIFRRHILIISRLLYN